MSGAVCEWNEEDVGSKTVALLKGELERLGAPTKGKKGELVARLVEIIKSQGNQDDEVENAADYNEEAMPVEEDTTNVNESSEPLANGNNESQNESNKRSRSPSPKQLSSGEENAAVKKARNASSSPAPRANSPSPPRNTSMSPGRSPPRSVIISPAREAERSSPSPPRRSTESVSPTRDTKRGRSPSPSPSPPPRKSVSPQREKPKESNFKKPVPKRSKAANVVVDEDYHHGGKGKSVAVQGLKGLFSVRIDNFVRPFVLSKAQKLVEDAAGEEAVRFWMNKIKSHAYVSFTTKAAAEKVVAALDGLRWPEMSVKTLSAIFTKLSADEAAIQAGRQTQHSAEAALVPDPVIPVISKPVPKPVPPAAKEQPAAVKPVGAKGASKAAVSKAPPVSEREREASPKRAVEKQVAVEKHEEPPKEPPPLDINELFQKTTAKPCLYFLPNTEEQIAVKKSDKGSISAPVDDTRDADRFGGGGRGFGGPPRRMSGDFGGPPMGRRFNRGPNQVCHDFRTTGNCRWGRDCRFIHMTPRRDSRERR